MTQANNRGLQYFESDSMSGLYEDMREWQDENEKRLLSISLQKDADKFCCIALTNPSEVVIKGLDHDGNWRQVGVSYINSLNVKEV